jgi:hypothetical protein
MLCAYSYLTWDGDQAFASLKATLVHTETLPVRCIRESLRGGVGPEQNALEVHECDLHPMAFASGRFSP